MSCNHQSVTFFLIGMKGKRVIQIILFSIAFLLILRMFEVINVYKNPTDANEPNLLRGSYMITSNIPSPNRLDFICFNAKDETFGSYRAIFRIIALPGDKLVINNGNVFVNGEQIDKQLRLKHAHSVNNKVLNTILLEEEQNQTTAYRLTDTTSLVYMEDPLALAFENEVKRIIKPKEKVDDLIQLKYKQPWNKDFFGPLILPENKYFVLGDNRDNATDSRIIGLVDKEDIIAVVISK